MVFRHFEYRKKPYEPYTAYTAKRYYHRNKGITDSS